MKRIFTAIALLAALAANAQSLSTTQLTTLKAAILAETDPTFVGYRNAGDNAGMANWYNVPSSVIVWRKKVPSEEIGKTVNYVAVVNLTATNLARVTDFLRLNPVEFDPSRSDIRDYFSQAFGGALGGQGQATRDALEAMYRRAATRGEALYETGTGTTVSPATLGYEGSITTDDVRAAMAL